MKELFTGTTLNSFVEATRVQPLIPEAKEEKREWDFDMLRSWALKKGYLEKSVKDYKGWFKYVGFVFEDKDGNMLAILRHTELHTDKWNYYFHHDQYGTVWSELYDSSADAIAALITTFHIRTSQWGQVQATVDKLTPVQKRIMKYLWARPSVNMQDVNRTDIEALTKLGLVKKLTTFTYGATEIGKRVGLWVEPEQILEQKGIPMKPESKEEETIRHPGEKEYHVEKWYLLYAPHLKDLPWQWQYQVADRWDVRGFKSHQEVSDFLAKGRARFYVHQVRMEAPIEWTSSARTIPALKYEAGRDFTVGDVYYKLVQPILHSHKDHWVWKVSVWNKLTDKHEDRGKTEEEITQLLRGADIEEAVQERYDKVTEKKPKTKEEVIAMLAKRLTDEGATIVRTGKPETPFTNWVVEVRTKRGKKHIYSYGVGSQAEAMEKAKKEAEKIYFENGEGRREVVVKSPPDSKVPDKVITFG